LQQVRSRLADADNRIAAAEIVTREAAALVGADSAALIIRAVEGARVLWLHPSGQLWGPQTLTALLSVGEPLRQVLDGDPLTGGGSTAVLVVPVASAGAHAGVIVARRAGGKAFSVNEQNLLDRLARMAGVTLDSLTRRGILGGDGDGNGLGDQDRLLRDLQIALRTSEDHGMPISLVACEIDGIAHMGTQAGPEQADEAFRLIASAIFSVLRVGDVPYRLSEHELAVLLAATDVEDAEHVATRLADEAYVACQQAFRVAHPLRLRTAVVPVVGLAEDVLAGATRALAAQRVAARWQRQVPNTHL
jgi:GGDEF domain-containing protein